MGDAFAAGYVSNLRLGPVEAAWRASYVATAYSQTTYPDVFELTFNETNFLTLQEMISLWRVSLPWERRRQLEIYLAAPDFTYVDRALASLEYHNFNVRRPVKEKIPINSDQIVLRKTFLADCELLKRAFLLFAVPTGRDPGTLVEIGMAIERGIPVVVFDAARENTNTMVMAGAKHYSDNLDSCLNAVFTLLGEQHPYDRQSASLIRWLGFRPLWPTCCVSSR